MTWGREITLVPDEFLIKVSKSQKVLKLFPVLRARPVSQHCYLLWVHLDAVGGQDEAQKGDPGGMEFAFSRHNKKTGPATTSGTQLRHVGCVLGIFGRKSGYHPNKQTQICLSFLRAYHSPALGRQHHKIFVMPSGGIKSCLPFIPFLNTHQVIGSAQIKLGMNAGPF